MLWQQYITTTTTLQVSFCKQLCFYIEKCFSKYSSSFLRLISLLVPTHNTNSQLSSLVSFRSLFIPIPEYDAASSSVRLVFSQIGTFSTMYYLLSLLNDCNAASNHRTSSYALSTMYFQADAMHHLIRGHAPQHHGILSADPVSLPTAGLFNCRNRHFIPIYLIITAAERKNPHGICKLPYYYDNFTRVEFVLLYLHPVIPLTLLLLLDPWSICILRKQLLNHFHLSYVTGHIVFQHTQ